MRCASSTSFSRVMRGKTLMSLRYWSSDPSSTVDFRFVEAFIAIASSSREQEIFQEFRAADLVDDLSEALPPEMCQPIQLVSNFRRVAIIDYYRLAAHK